jgi:hypothetical protein
MKNLYRISHLICLALLTACGGGGGGSGPAPINDTPEPVSGIGRTGIAMGTISTFGSIVVNGVHYDTDAATFTVNDQPGSQDDLSVGQVVIVKGSIDDDGTTGSADEVIFDDNVKGPIDSIDGATNQMVVLGQTVVIGPETSFDDSIAPPSLDGLNVGDIVEISGFVDANGNIAATRIELKPAGTPFEVHGLVSNLDTGNLRFNINALVVDYSGATLDNFPGGQISENDLVEAKGDMSGGELIASSVELENPLADGEDGVHLEIEGFITRFDSSADFEVAGFPVSTTANTVFEGGVANDLGLNVKVEAEGEIDGNGVLVAEEIEIRRAKSIRATANVDSVDAANDSLVLLGITTTIDAGTRLEDKSDAKVEPLTLNDINAGDYVEIRGDEFPAGSGTILATILERDDPDTDAILQGFVATVSDPSFTILSVTIVTNGTTVFRDENDIVISSADFFSQVATDSLVKATGTETSDTVITADEVEFETEF